MWWSSTCTFYYCVWILFKLFLCGVNLVLKLEKLELQVEFIKAISDGSLSECSSEKFDSSVDRAAGILSVCLICSFSVVSQQWRLCWFYCRSFWLWWLDAKVRCHKIIISEDKCDWFCTGNTQILLTLWFKMLRFQKSERFRVEI